MYKAGVAAALAAVLATCCAGAPAYADTKLLSGFASVHLAGQDWNENNYGLGIQKGPWAVGVYKNSIHRTSWYVAYEFMVDHGKLFYGAVVGAATGYHRPLVPFIMPEVGVGIGPAELALLVQPVKAERYGAVPFVALQLRWRF